MTSHELSIFLAACESGNFSGAARRLRLSQPAVSRTIRGLESSTALNLFRRNGRGVELTEAGRILRDHAQRIIAEHAEMEASLARLRSAEVGEVKVLLPAYVGRILIPPVIDRFASAFPQASIRIFEGAPIDTPQRLQAGEADLGIFYSPPCHRMPTSEPVAVEHICLVGRRDAIGESSTPITFDEAAALPLVLPSWHTPFRSLVDRAANAAGLRLHVTHELELGYTQLTFVMGGKGVTMMPYSHCYDEVERGLVVARPIVTPAISRQLLLATGQKRSDRLTRGSLAILKQVISEHLAAFHWEAPGR